VGLQNDVKVCVTDKLTYNDTICTSPGAEHNDMDFSWRSGILSFDDEVNKTFSHAWEMFTVPVVIGFIGGEFSIQMPISPLHVRGMTVHFMHSS
jgi:hypothetical protein